MTTNIKTILKYAKDDKTRPYLYAYQRSDEERKKTPHQKPDLGGTPIDVDVVVKDARSKGLCLDNNGFELVKQTTSLSKDDFYNSQEKIRQVYYPEMAEMIKKITKAAHVEVFHHQVRNEAKNNGGLQNLNTSVQGYASGVHSDSHPQAADELFIHLSRMPATKSFTRGRFLYINAWRNISEQPIGNNHLAVCDETSLVKPDDYITTDLYGEGYHLQQYRLSDRNSDQHRWYYYSEMEKDEVLLFKQWDSDRTLSGRLCFHTAFSDPNASKDTAPRESIEIRAIAYFPNHEPNTCPTIPVETKDLLKDEVEIEEEEIAGAALKVLRAINSVSVWPEMAQKWVVMEFSKGKPGIKALAEGLADDSTGYLGLKHFSKESKAKIVSELLKQNGFEQGLKIQVDCINSSEEKL